MSQRCCSDCQRAQSCMNGRACNEFLHLPQSVDRLTPPQPPQWITEISAFTGLVRHFVCVCVVCVWSSLARKRLYHMLGDKRCFIFHVKQTKNKSNATSCHVRISYPLNLLLCVRENKLERDRKLVKPRNIFSPLQSGFKISWVHQFNAEIHLYSEKLLQPVNLFML